MDYSAAGNAFRVTDLETREVPPHLDGVLILQNFRLRVINRDGSEAASCGNGLRCIGRYLLDTGHPQGSYAIQTGDRTVTVHCFDEIGVDLGAPRDYAQHGEFDFVNTGVPHLVCWVDSLEFDIEPLAYPLRVQWNANVNFAVRGDPIRVRTYERGVGETLSCGTGAAAVAYSAHRRFKASFPIHLNFRGGDLRIELGLKLFGNVKPLYI